MASKRKRPGRPPKPRGPGRPKGSKNRPKLAKRVRPSVAARLSAVDYPPTIGLPLSRPKRPRGRPPKARATVQQPAPAMQQALRFVQQNEEQFDRDRRYVREGFNAISLRITELAQALQKLKADAEHPTTVLLARRLLILEGRERVANLTGERFSRIEEEIRSIRHDLNGLLTAQHELRNLAEIVKLASEPDGPFGDGKQGETEQENFFDEDNNDGNQPNRAAE